MLREAFTLSALAVGAFAQGQYGHTSSSVSITVKSSGGNATSGYQYGLMFEDINNSGDGGVYAELVQNRAFQGDSVFPSNLTSWSGVCGAEISLHNLSTPLSAALPTSMRVSGSGKGIGFSNTGFWGFPLVADWTYKGSFWVHGSYSGNITVSIQSILKEYENNPWVQTSVEVASTEDAWTQYNYTFQPSESAPNSNNTLVFTWDATGTYGDSSLDFNLISLFPPTYKDRENGLRIDLMEAMADLKPSFFRAPGGNNIEGLRLPYWWNWTQTIGPLEDRPGYPGTWSYENTNGLGLIEYMLWAQDLGMEPLLAVWSGLWLDKEVVPEDKLQIYIQAALDELEFLMGSPTTKWGAIRSNLGYPSPFPINFVEIGNEDSISGGKESYESYRFQAFYNAIHAAYPNITIIGSYYNFAGATPSDGAAGDYHEYSIPIQMSSQFSLFDNYTSAHPILIGEFAVLSYDLPNKSKITWEHGALRSPAPFWYGSVAEAIFLLGAERNADKVIGASYAPMFQNWNRWQWIPNLISYDAFPGHTTLSTSYYVIKLYSGTRMTETLPMEGAEFGPAYYVAGRNADTGVHILKAAVYNATEEVEFNVAFEGVEGGVMGTLTWLTAPMNASQPVGGNIVETHVEDVKSLGNGTFRFSLSEYSVAVLEVKGAGSYGEREGWKGHKWW